MKTLLLLLCLTFFITIDSMAQTDGIKPIDRIERKVKRPIESFYVEALGNTTRYSFNFDVVFPSGLGFRVGGLTDWATKLDCQGESYSEATNVAFLLTLNQLYGHGPHYMEMGVGFVTANWDANPFKFPLSHALTATLGYRYHHPVKRFILRAGFTPILMGKELRPMIGASIGYSIKGGIR